MNQRLMLMGSCESALDSLPRSLARAPYLESVPGCIFPCFPTPCLAEPRRDAATSGALQPEEIWHIASLVGPAPLTWWQLDALPAHGVGHSFEYALLI